MRTVLLVTALIVCLGPQWAGSHEQGIDEITATEIVVDAVRKLTDHDLDFDVEQLDKSWESVTTD